MIYLAKSSLILVDRLSCLNSFKAARIGPIPICSSGKLRLTCLFICLLVENLLHFEYLFKISYTSKGKKEILREKTFTPERLH